METKTYLPLLQALGLNDNEASLYLLLLDRGRLAAGDAATESGLGRANAYNVLASLERKNLALAIQGKHLAYEAVDPSKLQNLVTERVREAEQLKQQLGLALPGLISNFNLSTGKPAVQVFEGLDGVAQVLNDSLTAKTEILTIVSPEALSKDVLDIEAKYIRKRVNAKISKRVILPDTPLANQWIKEPDSALTTTRIIKGLNGSFKTAIEIYDDCLSMITLNNQHLISVLINDKNMAELQRAVFESLWNSSSSSDA